ncbi:hypothetical protein CYMTET_37165 [Cymbomonas tetramitiformis]|uniref:Sde2 N-terminal ubiquitin domain-containing protein n=1 Tax=Cymbomonas tetramitiformis TaxID=36881 RepID=A0AAE0CGN5_9CHLO|nr:hypothetical protein CYMTET_37165 [Cymbomonas tetramitiformis]
MRDCQVLLRDLEGRTRCLQFLGNSVDGLEIKRRLHVLDSIPVSVQRIVCGAREVDDATILYADARGEIPSCSALLRLRGGKGGFGSLLRGAAKKKNMNDNQDACRDLSGRRLRHVNAEKKLGEWENDAKERQLEQDAIDFIKKKEAEERATQERKENDLKLDIESSQTVAKVQNSVQSGLKEAMKAQEELKRKKAAAEGTAIAKRQRIMNTLGDISDEDMSDSDDEGVVKKMPEAAASVQDPPPASSSPKKTSVRSEDAKPANAEGNLEPIDLSKYDTPTSLEVCGMELLKTELQKHGLKCGGSLQDRAGRLFLLKNTPLSALDGKHFAKPVKKA